MRSLTLSRLLQACAGRRFSPARRRLLTYVAALTAGALTLSRASLHAARESISETLAIGGGSVIVVFPGSEPSARRKVILEWIDESARAVATYFGRLPVQQVHVLVSVTSGDDIHGATYGRPRAFIRLPLGRAVSDQQLRGSWVAAHEMVHLAFPSVPDRHNWLHEGIATYVEPVARAQAGVLPVEKVWSQLVAGLPQGLPAYGDRGLDRTPTWGRIYWGGALFCLLADVEIRVRTANQRGLQHALRGIVGAGGTLETNWSLPRALEVGDRATGTTVLTEQYESMKEQPVGADLDELWHRLGVLGAGNELRFDDRAALAHVRQAITTPLA